LRQAAANVGECQCRTVRKLGRLEWPLSETRGGEHVEMPTVGALESRLPRVPRGRLAGLSVTRSAGSDRGADRCGAEFLWRAARRNAACFGFGTEGTLPETGAGRARDVRCAVHGAAVGRPDME